jgi:hypothetical protein
LPTSADRVGFLLAIALIVTMCWFRSVRLHRYYISGLCLWWLAHILSKEGPAGTPISEQQTV